MGGDPAQCLAVGVTEHVPAPYGTACICCRIPGRDFATIKLVYPQVIPGRARNGIPGIGRPNRIDRSGRRYRRCCPQVTGWRAESTIFSRRWGKISRPPGNSLADPQFVNVTGPVPATRAGRVPANYQRIPAAIYCRIPPGNSCSLVKAINIKGKSRSASNSGYMMPIAVINIGGGINPMATVVIRDPGNVR